MAIVKRYIRLSMVALLSVSAGLLVPRIVASRGAGEDVREIRLVARDMTYYLDDGGGPDNDVSDDPNPVLKFRAGERVKLVFRNEDPGMAHDFTIRVWGVGTRLLNGKGDDSITFRVPKDAKSARYICTPHAGMMSGQVVIE